MGACERYTILFKIRFQIVCDAGMTVAKGNRLTKELVEKLKNFKFVRRNIKAWNSELEELQIWQPSPNIARGKINHVKFEVSDTDKDESKRVYMFNNQIKGHLAAEFKSWTFAHYTTKLTVTEVSH